MAFLLQPILSSLLGDFILGIDKNCFKTDLKNNTVGLFDTRLNPKILDNIQFPIKLGYSSLGKMLFKITKKKGQDPNEITLENIYVVFEITDSMKPYDIIEERVNFLAELSKKCMSEINKLKQGPQKPKKDPFEQFKSYFLDNLQVFSFFFSHCEGLY